MTVSAFHSGKLNALNFSPVGKDIQNLTAPQRKDLCRCATELLEYSFLIQHEMTSFSSKQYFNLFDQSVSRVEAHRSIPGDFNRLASLEGFPNLKTLYSELNDPFEGLPKLRVKRSSVAFRKWLAETNSSTTDVDIAKEYVESIAEKAGFFETKKGKLTKSVVMTGIGTGIGAVIGGAEGALGGALVGKVVEVGADLALDLIDEFLISGLTKGWSPRMFFDDLSKLREP
jgi:tetrahydromethanopterin S-methyltransferase subunit F